MISIPMLKPKMLKTITPASKFKTESTVAKANPCTNPKPAAT